MKSLFIFVCLFFVVSTTQAQIEAYSRNTIGGKTEFNLNVFGQRKITEKIYLITFALVEKDWAQGLLGLSYQPKSWLKFDVRAGIEQNPALYRLGASLFLQKEKISFQTFFEKGDGKKNYFYKSVLLFETTEKFAFGAIAWRFHGFGPICEFKLTKDYKLFLAPVYDLESKDKRIIAGVGIKI